MSDNKREYVKDNLGRIKALHFPEANDVNNLHVVEEYINNVPAGSFSLFLEQFVRGQVYMDQDCGFLLPERQMYDMDEVGNDVQVLDCAEQAPGLQFLMGIDQFTEAMVSFEDAKRYFRMAAETHISLHPEYKQAIEAALEKADAKLDEYAANRAAYLADHPEEG